MPDHESNNLERFVAAQENVYETVLAELRSGMKQTHWMWFIFPQIEGLGHSPTSRYYSIKSREEARQYLSHPVLGPRLLECAAAVMGIDGRSASEIFGSLDEERRASVLDLLSTRRPRSLCVCTLLDKVERREVEIPVQYRGFTIPNKFVFGYGLDIDDYYRNLPFVGVVDLAKYQALQEKGS